MTSTTTLARGRSRSRATGSVSRRSSADPLSRTRKKLFWPFVGPALALYVLLFIAPALSGVWISLHSWRGAGDEMRYTGFANYRRLWNDDAFISSLLNSLKILAICGVAIFILAFVITMTLREMKWRRGLRSLLLFPYIVSPIAIGVGLGLILDPSGLVNASLRGVGLGALAKPWLSPDHLLTTILTGIVWVTTGFYVILISAGMDRIPAYFYEDSQLAGANRFQQFWHVTLPLSWDVISVSAVLWVINSLKIFEFIYAFVGTGDSPPAQARTVPIYQFLMTSGGHSPAYQMGYGCAMGVVMVALVTVLVVLLRRIMRRDVITF